GPQRFQLRLREAGSQIGGGQLALPVAAIELEGVDDSDYGPESHRFGSEIPGQLTGERGALIEPDEMLERHQQRVFENDAQRGKEQRQRHRRSPVAPVNRIAAKDPEEKRRKEGARIPVGKHTGQALAPIDRQPPARHVDRALRAGERGQESPRGENQQHLLHGRATLVRKPHSIRIVGILKSSYRPVDSPPICPTTRPVRPITFALRRFRCQIFAHPLTREACLITRVAITALCLYSLGLSAQSTAPAGRPRGFLQINPGELAAFVDPIVNAQLAKEHIPGAVLVLVQDGKIVYQRGYGFADLATRKPVDPAKTIWRIGSISKVFTATAVVQLADRGRFRLTDDVNMYLTRFKVPATFPQPVRIWNLLTHTAAFDEIRPGTRAETKAGLLSLGDFLAPKLVRLRPPGQLISYSTYGISLAGYLVEQISGLDFERYLRDNVWLPLGMTRTNIDVPDSLKGDVAIGYEWTNGSNQPASWEWYHSTPASSINATGVDMAHFIIAQLQNGRYGNIRILSDSAARDMHRQHVTSHPELPGFAYGFYEDFTNGERLLEHGGNVEGFSAQLALLPDRNIGFFIASQHEPAELRDVVQRALLDHYFPD